MAFKRALVSVQKGIFSKPIGRLFKAKRASIKKQGVKKYYNTKPNQQKKPSPNGKGLKHYDTFIRDKGKDYLIHFTSLLPHPLLAIRTWTFLFQRHVLHQNKYQEMNNSYWFHPKRDGRKYPQPTAH